jgi:hypothetical protein
MFLDPTPMSSAFLVMQTPDIPDEEVVKTAPLNKGPPRGTRAGKKRLIRPQPTNPADKSKRQKVGMPFPKKQRPIATG